MKSPPGKVGALLFLGLWLAGLTSCVTPPPASEVEVPVVLWFEEFNEVYRGTVTQRGSFLSSEIDVRATIGHARCVGMSFARIVPPAADPPRRCDGIRGEALLSCSDKRRLAFEWWNDEGCGRGYGKGQDPEGRVLRLVYGGTSVRAGAMVKEAQLDLRRKPKLPDMTDRGPKMSTGTAFFVSWDGHLLTNHHVVRKAKTVKVRLGDGDLVDARVINRDETNDLALLKVEAIRRPLYVRRRHELSKGLEVFTLGYPLVALQGQEQKATFGRVNALTGLQGDDRFTQIDVPIQPGNSGGPLLTQRGEVVGVVTSMLHPLATLQIAGVLPQNVNYALKSDFAYSLIAQNLREGWDGKRANAKGADIEGLIDDLEDSVVLVVAY